MYGTLHIQRGRPNPDSAGIDALYLFRGAPAAAPIHEIVSAPDVTLPGPPDLSPDHPFHLHVLHFNDLHGRLADVSADAIRPVFSRMADYIRRAREGSTGRPDAGVLVFSGGDDLVGTAFSELGGSRPANFVCHPAYRLYSAAGVDAGGIGNHDLDWGLGVLALAARQDAAFPLLAANLLPARDADAAGVYPAALFVVKGVRIGVIGLTTPAECKNVLPGEFTIVDPVAAMRNLLPGEFTIVDPVAAMRNLLPAFRPLCDVVIVLSHLGYSLADPRGIVAGSGDVELALALPPGIVQLIVGGHTHSVFHATGLDDAQVVNGIPIVQAGARGRYLGEAEVDVTSAGALVIGARLLTADALAPDAAFEADHVRPLAEQVQRRIGEPIGQAAPHPDLATERVREAFAAGESALANFIADALAARCRAAGFQVDFALVDTSSVCAGLPAGGAITFGDLFAVMPFADSIVLRRLSPAQLHALLDDNACRADRPDERSAERGFLHFSREVRYGIIRGETRAQAYASGATLDGIPAEALSRPLWAACSSFVRGLASGWERQCAGQGWSVWDLRALPAEQTGLALRDEILAFIREHGGVTEAAGLQRDGRLVITWDEDADECGLTRMATVS